MRFYINSFKLINYLFKICCISEELCQTDETIWVETLASAVEGFPLSIRLTVPNSCISKELFGFRYLWRETPCEYKQCGIYNSEDENIPSGPYIKYI